MLDRKHLNALGTIGGGNHFAEFQETDQIVDPETFTSLGLDPNEVFMLVHSGSRSLGESILGKFVEEHKGAGEAAKGTYETSDEFLTYMRGHETALNFARRNRFLIAHRILEQIDSRRSQPGEEYSIRDENCIVDIFHNFVEKAPVL